MITLNIVMLRLLYKLTRPPKAGGREQVPHGAMCTVWIPITRHRSPRERIENHRYILDAIQTLMASKLASQISGIGHHSNNAPFTNRITFYHSKSELDR